MKGYIKEIAHDFAPGEQVPSRGLDLFQTDDVRLSDAIVDHHARYHLAAVHTSDHKVAYSTSADTVTLSAGIYFTVGGVTFSTDDLSSRDITIPDNSTKYIYLQVADDCGAVVDWNVDPIERKRTVDLLVEDTEQETTASKLLILKATKGAGGTIPTVTAYVNDGYSGILPTNILPGSIGGLLVTKASATQLRVSPGYCHLRDSSGVDHLVELSSAVTIDLTLSGGGRVWVYIDSAGNLSTATSAYPTRDEAKGGLYNAAGDKRAIGWAPYQSDALLDFRLADNGRVLHLIGRQVMGTSAHDGFSDQSVPVHPAVDGAIAYGGFRTSPTSAAVYLYATRPDGSTDPNGTVWAGDNAMDYTSGLWEEEITAAGVYELDTANQTLGRHYQFGVRLDR